MLLTHPAADRSTMPHRCPHATITIDVPGHGTFTARAATVDQMIRRYLLAPDVANLRREAEQASGIDMTDVYDATTVLVMLADFHDARERNAAA
jgi:hypothetical protein